MWITDKELAQTRKFAELLPRRLIIHVRRLPNGVLEAETDDARANVRSETLLALIEEVTDAYLEALDVPRPCRIVFPRYSLSRGAKADLRVGHAAGREVPITLVRRTNAPERWRMATP